MSMQVIAIDGTVIKCDNIKPKSKGLMLQKKQQKTPETIGFIPFDRLMYVIPEETVHKFDEMEEMPT